MEHIHGAYCIYLVAFYGTLVLYLVYLADVHGTLSCPPHLEQEQAAQGIQQDSLRNKIQPFS